MARASTPASWGVSVVLGVFAAPCVAGANGRFPQAQSVVVGPGRGSSVLMVRTTFGLVVSDDSGRSFKHLCEEALEIPDGYDAAVALNAEGALLVGLSDGLMVARDRCTARRRDELQSLNVRDLATDPTGRIVVAALVTGDTVPLSRVARSEDGGEHFTVSSDGMTGVVLDTIELAPSSSLRVYASGHALHGGGVRLFRSDDGGLRWRTVIELLGVSGAFVSAVDSRNPEGLWVRVSTPRGAMDAGSPGEAQGPSALLRSDDGGEHLREVARTRGPMLGFALSDDDRRVFLGGPDPGDGLLRSEDYGQSFSRVNDARVECLKWHQGVLYVCETYQPYGVLLGRSMDDGRTIDPVVTFDGIDGPPRCAASTSIGGVCPLRWPAVRAMIAPVPRRDGAVMNSDGGVVRPPPDPKCDCSVPPKAQGSAPWTLLAFAWIWRSHRRFLKK